MVKRNARYKIDGMDIEITKSSTEICLVVDFKINGKNAFIFDFGRMKDVDPEHAPASGCGDRSFIPYRPISPNLLKTYSLTEEQANTLLDFLEEKLHVGYCKRCR